LSSAFSRRTQHLAKFPIFHLLTSTGKSVLQKQPTCGIESSSDKSSWANQTMNNDLAFNPLGGLLDGTLSACDFGVMEHGFAPHGRDYRFVIQDSMCGDPGTYELVFRHVVDLKYMTRVGDAAWQTSWSDEFTDYSKWQAAGEPEGYVFGTEWSLAYPGIEIPTSSPEAQSWSERLQRQMYSATIETDRFTISLIFSDVRHRKLSGETGTVRQSVIHL